MSETRVVGRVKDAHGIKGELFITLFPKEADWLKKLKTVALKKTETTSEVQTYTVKSARIHKNGLIVKTVEIPDRNAAELLKGYFFEIPAEFLVSNKGESLYLVEIEGFDIHQDGTKIGKIVAFSTNGAQDLLVVKTKDGEFDIPFVEAFVKKIDYDNKFIDMNLPEGLFDTENAHKDEGNDPAEDDLDDEIED